MAERVDRRSLLCRLVATLVLFLLTPISAGAATPAERNALISLYNATGGPQWKTNTGWLGAPGTECGWTKINCDANGSVVNLFLGSNNLVGTIPAAIGDLPRLQRLYLDNNVLSGPIPPQIGALASLSELALSTNQLSGPIPPQLGALSNLKSFFLGVNALEGPIPPSFGNLTNLEYLSLANNKLTGTIPDLSRMTKLIGLYLRANKLTGSIPPLGGFANLEDLLLDTNELSGSIPSLAGVPKLERLHLYKNRLSGPIPNDVRSLTSLQELWLYENELSGSLPSQIGALASLRTLFLATNKFSGPMPEAIGDLSNLQELVLSNNQIGGEIPATLGKLTKLQNLSIANNALTGRIPDLVALSQLRILQAGTNQLTGPIPATLTNLTALEDLRLNRNQLSGPIPSDIGRLVNLTYLDLFQNQLSGPVPPGMSSLFRLRILYLAKNALTGTFINDLGKLPNLVQLIASENLLEGSLPADLGNLKNLTYINLYKNKISGAIPDSIGDLAALTEVQLGLNQFSGPIPPSIARLSKLQKLMLNHNQLTGTLPPAIGNLTNLLELNVYSNQLSGPIPAELEHLTALTKLTLGSNRFSGTIPAGLRKLTNLRELNFYFNQLSGTVPIAIADLPNLEILSFATNSLEGRIPPQLGRLAKLRQLILTANKLEGSIPREIASLTNLEALTVDANQLSGDIPPELVNLQKLIKLDLRFNGLTASDPALRTFLTQKQFDWDQYQNVPPGDVRVIGTDATTVVLSWTPISLRSGPGGYQIAAANTPSGPFTIQLTTAGKWVTSAIVTGLSAGTDYFFGVRSVAYPNGPYQQNQLTSDFAPAVQARTTPAGTPTPNVAVFAYPSGAMIRGLGVDRDDRYVLTNIGQAATTITLAQSGQFFTQSPASFTLPPGASRTVALRGTDQAPGVYEGTSTPSGTGVPAGLTIPVRLLTISLTPSNVVAVPSATRIDLTTDTNGSVDFTNSGSDTLMGVFVSDAEWIEPQTRGLIEIRPGQRVTLRFSVNRARRPTADGSLTGGLYLVYPRTAAGLLAMLADPLGSGNPAVGSSTVSVVDTPRPPVSQASAPPLSAGEVALFIPGIGTVRGPNALYISDVNIVNAFGAAAISNVRIYYTPETPTVLPSRADLPPLSPNSLVSYGNVVRSVFESESTGTLQIRAGGAIESITASARIFNIQGANGTYGTAVPVFRSDRAARAGEEIVLTGVRKDAITRTNIFVQEMSGFTARFDIRFLDTDGAQIGDYSGEVNPFSLRRVLDQVPAGAVTAVITNAADSAGRIGAYATPLDSRSNDFWSVVDWSRHHGYERFEPMLLPVAGTVRGANNTFFRSDLMISNRSRFAQKGILRFISRSSQAFESLIELDGGRSLGLNDLLGEHFRLVSDAGYLVFAPLCLAADESLGVGACDATFSLASRNFATVGNDPGTFGTAVPAMALASALRVGQSRLIGGIEDVANTRGPGTYRTNVGLLETTGAPATLRVTVIKPETRGLVRGVSGASIEVALGPREYRQINGIATSVLGSDAEIRNASLLFEVIGGEGAVIVFASSVDNGTGDAVLRVE